MAVTLPGELSEEGIRNAQALGHAATMASPPFSVRISGAVQTATIAFDGKRVVVIGHAAQRYLLRSLFEGMTFEEAVAAPFQWQEGWEYRFSARDSEGA